MKRKLSILLSSIVVTTSITMPVYGIEASKVSRLYGNTRYDTSIKIAEEFIKDGKLDGVIIASGESYPDALTGSILSKSLNIPILLVNKTINNSSKQLEFIETNLSKDGKIYLLGGNAVVDNDFISYLKNKKFTNIQRLGGQNRYETNAMIIKEANVNKNTPVIIANANSFPDSLSISNISSMKGYPILLTHKDILSESLKENLKNIEPNKIFIVGGTSVVSDNVKNQIKNILNIEDSNIIRLGGQNRYETSTNILKYFNNDLSKENIFLASGQDFPDALSVSALAGKKKEPVLLTTGDDMLTRKNNIDEFKGATLLGGELVLDKFCEKFLKGEKQFDFCIKNAYEENGEKYIEGNFSILSDDVDLVKKYIAAGKVSPDWILKDEYGEEYIADKGCDIPISSDLKLKVNNDAKITALSYPEGKVVSYEISFGKINELKNRQFLIDLDKNNNVSQIEQVYRP